MGSDKIQNNLTQYPYNNESYHYPNSAFQRIAMQNKTSQQAHQPDTVEACSFFRKGLCPCGLCLAWQFAPNCLPHPLNQRNIQ